MLVINRQNLLSSNLLSENKKIMIYRTIILDVVLYGCETLLLTFRQECRLRVFQNSVLRRLFGPKREKVTGEWIKLHNVHNLPKVIRVIKSRRMRWACHVAGMGDRTGVYRVLVGKPEGKKPLRRSKHTWKDDMKVDLQEVGWRGGMVWIVWLRIGTGGRHM